MRWLRTTAAGAALLTLGLGGCGAEEAPAPRATPTGQPLAPPSEANAARNQRPVIDEVVLRPADPRPGDTLRAEARATDPDGDALTLEYIWRLNGRTVGDGSSRLRLGQERKGSLIEVSVIARDGFEGSAPETASVRIGNQPPMLLGVVFEPRGEIRGDRDLVVEPRAQDPDGDELSYRYAWRVNGRSIDEEGPRLAARHFGRGDRIGLSVIASDGMVESDPLETDTITVTNAPPRITSEPGPIGADGRFVYRVVAEDPDGDRRFGYRLVAGPAGMSVDPVDGLVSWTPSPAQTGSHPVEIEVDDRRGGRATQAFRLELRYGDDVPAARAR